MDEPTGVVEETQQEVAAPDTGQPEETGVESASPAEVSEETKVQDDASEGLLAAKEAETKRRQTAETEAQQARTRAEILEQELQKLRQQPVQQSKDIFDGKADDDFVYISDVKNYLNNVKEEFAKERQVDRIMVSESMARMQHEDYDEVVGKLKSVATQQQLAIIAGSNNPAETAYNFVKASPEYIRGLEQKTTEQVANKTIDTINQHIKKPKTLSTSGSGKMEPKSVIRNMSDEEFDRLVNDVQMGKDVSGIFGRR